jgi:hypothetical protein
MRPAPVVLGSWPTPLKPAPRLAAAAGPAADPDQPPGRADRLGRRLRFAVTDIRNGEQVKQLTRQPGPRSEQERMEEVRAIAARGH